MKILEIYDLECLSNMFTYTGYRPKTDEWFQYVICPWRNDGEALYKHLTEGDLYQVGFNNLAYDYPLEHHFIRHWVGECEYHTGLELAQQLYAKSQYLIDQLFTEVKKPLIPQIDLYKIWHYNNAARSTSLKDLEIAMRMDSVEEMPIHHTHWCREGDEIQVLSYNKNDVLATYKFLLVTLGKTDYPLYKGKNKLELRSNIKKKFHVDVTNLGDVPMGEELMLNLYARATGQNPYFIKKNGGTPRSSIALKDCIPHWCKLKSKEFNKFLTQLKNTVIKGEKGEFQFSVIFHGISFDFGTGGAHGCIAPGVYESDDKWIILDLDVSSLYPSVAKSLKLYPEHLGIPFMQQYSGFIDTRINEKHKPKEEKDNVLIEGYKLVLNGTYGKSKEEKSFLYDPLYTYRTTIAGQLFISMWAERMAEAVPELKFIQINTDGITIMIPRDKLELIRQVNEQLTKETTLVIEEAFYSKMFIRDVNNYGAVYVDSTKENEHIKLKGDFEVDKEFHKDPSMRIVPLALKNYFVYNIPVEDTIKQNRDIFNFCLRLKTNSKSTPFYKYLQNGRLQEKRLDRTTRYYISNSGGAIYKDFGEGRASGVNVGFSITLFNKFEDKEWDDYDINYNFYISEANKIKNPLVVKELDLFSF
jgi:hypothetical protein